MAKPKREIKSPDLSNPPTATDFFDALKQILTTDRQPVKSENREPTSEELNTKYRLRRKPAA
ncbi:MAG: hypothetical protein OXE42_11140 [Gammaproteobacteria bacterium]|nr:hypothetical protein [Gammaproteobacteria bacterium]